MSRVPLHELLKFPAAKRAEIAQEIRKASSIIQKLFDLRNDPENSIGEVREVISGFSAAGHLLLYPSPNEAT